MKDRPIGIFDSGVGGLKVMTAIKRVLGGEDIIYVFDRKHSPYGGRSDGYVTRRAQKVCSLLASRGVKAIVVACNTATAIAIDKLRAQFSLPIVGVEPPVKPAALTPGDGKVLLLCTKATARQKRILSLVDRYGKDNVLLAPMPRLATLIENNFSDLSAIKDSLDGMLSPYDGENIKAVALGCTHYYHVKRLIEEHYGGDIPVFSGEDGTANRLEEILKERDLLSDRKLGRVKYIYL